MAYEMVDGANQYKICYLLRVTIKGQVVANFIAELTPNEEGEVSQDPSSTVEESPSTSHLASTQDLYVDGSLNDSGCGVGLIFSSPPPQA